jgi:hypothetical protein
MVNTKSWQLLNWKWSTKKEAFLCLGVAAVVENNNTTNNTNADNNNQLVGKQLAPFIYSNKEILSIKDWKKKAVQEIARIKRFEKSNFWCTLNQSENMYGV